LIETSGAQWVKISTPTGYRSLGGAQAEPVLRPGAWDLAFTNGMVIELDEELHFNRHRALALSPEVPWADDYLRFSLTHESNCLQAGRWGLR